MRSRSIGDWVASVILWATAILVFSVFAWILFSIARGGVRSLSWDFLISVPEASGRAGGISSVLVSTFWILLICLFAAVPIGFATALLLSEFVVDGAPWGRFVRRSLDVLAGVPSIIFGLFGSVFFCQVLGLGYSLFAGGLTLACMVLPILIRSAEAGFRAVPNEYRASATALGLSHRATIFRVVVPAATPSLVAGLVLGLGRAAAETAALLYTSGYVDRMPGSLLDSGRTLTVHIFDLAMNVPGGNDNAYASAVVLLILLLLINVIASFAGKHGIRRRFFLS